MAVFPILERRNLRYGGKGRCVGQSDIMHATNIDRRTEKTVDVVCAKQKPDAQKGTQEEDSIDHLQTRTRHSDLHEQVLVKYNITVENIQINHTLSQNQCTLRKTVLVSNNKNNMP